MTALQIQRSGEPRASFGEVSAKLPVSPQPRGHLDGQVRFARLDGPAQGGPEVRVVDVQPLQPVGLTCLGEMWCGLREQCRMEGGVPLPNGAFLTCGPQLLERVLADGLDHPVPWRLVVRGPAEQAGLDESGEDADDIAVLVGAQRLGRSRRLLLQRRVPTAPSIGIDEGPEAIIERARVELADPDRGFTFTLTQCWGRRQS